MENDYELQRTRRGGIDKSIRLSSHARGYLLRRGFTEEEVHETIRTCPWQPAQRERQEATKDFPYHAYWNGIFYRTKRVRPFL